MGRVIFLIFTVFYFVGLSAQQTKVFYDENQSVQGRITHWGQYSDTILPKQGNYSLQWRDLDSLHIYTFSASGNLNNHLPNNTWYWQQAKLKYTISAGRTFQPEFSTSGTLAKWTGSFDKGTPRQVWNFTIDSVDNGGKTFQQLVKVKLPYKNGKVAGKFTVEDLRKDKQFSLSGHTNDLGEAEGVWLYTYKTSDSLQVTEKHTYKQGILLKIEVFGKDTGIVEYALNQKFFEAQKASEMLMQIGNHEFVESEYHGYANKVWKELMLGHYLSGWNLEVFPFSPELSLPFFRRIEFPLTDEEIRQIASIRKLSSNTQEQIDNYIEGEMLIQRSRSSALDLSISFLEQTKLRMQLLDSLMNRTELPLFTYKNRYQPGVLKYIESINEMAQVKAQVYDTLSIELPIISYSDGNFDLFKELELLAKISGESLQEHFDIIEKETFTLQRETERKLLEEELMLKLKNLQQLYESEQKVGKLIKERWIDGNLQQEIIRYAQKDDYEKAMALGENILLRIDTLAQWIAQVEIYDSMVHKIKSEYSRMVYNPYTGKNDLELIVKKRFLSNIIEILWPWLEQNIESEEDWSSWNKLWDQQFEVYNYVMTFASREDKQAQKINHRVRKENNPERILRMLN
jgi:hypothetical protein